MEIYAIQLEFWEAYLLLCNSINTCSLNFTLCYTWGNLRGILRPKLLLVWKYSNKRAAHCLNISLDSLRKILKARDESKPMEFHENNKTFKKDSLDHFDKDVIMWLVSHQVSSKKTGLNPSSLFFLNCPY
jgi:hypothetical protein